LRNTAVKASGLSEPICATARRTPIPVKPSPQTGSGHSSGSASTSRPPPLFVAQVSKRLGDAVAGPATTGRAALIVPANSAARSTDGDLDIKLPEPHLAAEQLFAAAWVACFIGAIELAAAENKIAPPTKPAVNATINLVFADKVFFLRQHLDVSAAGVDREVARALVGAAHGICPYSKATRGNINVELNVI
jgi:lipoyl-dependent peroxiredoxin